LTAGRSNANAVPSPVKDVKNQDKSKSIKLLGAWTMVNDI